MNKQGKSANEGLKNDNVIKTKKWLPKTVALIMFLFVLFLFALFIIRTYFFSVVEVNGVGMEPTINQGEAWLIDKTDKDFSSQLHIFLPRVLHTQKRM